MCACVCEIQCEESQFAPGLLKGLGLPERNPKTHRLRPPFQCEGGGAGFLNSLSHILLSFNFPLPHLFYLHTYTHTQYLDIKHPSDTKASSLSDMQVCVSPAAQCWGRGAAPPAR